MSNDESWEAVNLCNKQSNLQVLNLFATKINSKDDEEIYPITVQEIVDAQLAHPKYKNYFKDELKIGTPIYILEQ